VLSVRLPPLRERRDEIAPLAAHFLARFAEAEPGSPARHLSAEAVALLERHDWPGNIRQLENAVHRAVVLADGPTLGIDDFPQIGALQPRRTEPVSIPETDATAGPAEETDTVRMAKVQPFEGESTVVPDGFGEDGELVTLEALEAAHIRRAVAHYGGHMSEIARRLGIGRSTLYRKMRLYGIFEAEAGFDKDKQ
jgi:DNA-binding NtrC family response regulator